MAIHPETGLILQTEHGPSWDDAPGGGDEVNLITAGSNYGWPLVHHREKLEGTAPPLVEYTPALAPAGCTFYLGDAFPAWRGDFFFANLKGKRLVRLKMDGLRPVGQEHLLNDSSITTAAGQMLDNEVLPFAAALQKPVILAFAIPSAAVDGTVNLQAQMDAYGAVFTAVNQRAWISGVVSRGYSLPVILHDGSASINGTPTSDLLWYWLADFRGISR